jgi:hypothetical protein
MQENNLGCRGDQAPRTRLHADRGIPTAVFTINLSESIIKLKQAPNASEFTTHEILTYEIGDVATAKSFTSCVGKNLFSFSQFASDLILPSRLANFLDWTGLEEIRQSTTFIIFVLP